MERERKMYVEETPCEIGQFVYTIDRLRENIDNEYDYIPRKQYGKDMLIIRENKVDGFIIDDGGLFPAECGWDGWTKITTYNAYSCMNNKYNFDRVFYNRQDAIDFLNDVE